MKSSKTSNPDLKKTECVSKEDFEENLKGQDTTISETLRVLSEFNLKTKDKLEIDFFFYTDTAEKASELSRALKKLDFEVSCHEPTSNRNIFSVICWTDKMVNDEELLIYWSKYMCQLAYTLDCEYDGWGMVTYPE